MRPSYVAEQRHNRRWQCQGVLQLDVLPTNHPDLSLHSCTLPRGHYALHLCWCGSTFSTADVFAQQEPLPGL